MPVSYCGKQNPRTPIQSSSTRRRRTDHLASMVLATNGNILQAWRHHRHRDWQVYFGGIIGVGFDNSLQARPTLVSSMFHCLPRRRSSIRSCGEASGGLSVSSSTAVYAKERLSSSRSYSSSGAALGAAIAGEEIDMKRTILFVGDGSLYVPPVSLLLEVYSTRSTGS